MLKSSSKRRNKKDVDESESAAVLEEPQDSNHTGEEFTNGTNGGYESAYIREVQK